jgi:hypothetical protein
VQRIVIHADVSIQRIRAIHLLKHERHFIPSFNNFRQQVVRSARNFSRSSTADNTVDLWASGTGPIR